MKLLFILHGVHRSLGIEWLTNGLINKRFELCFILINDQPSYMETFLENKGIRVIRMANTSKLASPFFLIKLIRAMKRFAPDAVHTHLRDADLYGQIAAYILRIKKRIYTRHSSTYNHLYHKRSVLIDRVINSLCTDIIAISQVTKDVLIELEHVDPSKISLIHHGFDLASFSNVEKQRVDDLRARHNIPEGKTVIGMISRYTAWKGYQYAIPAFGELQKKHKNLHFIFANANGDHKAEIELSIRENLKKEAVTQIPFDNDIQALYKLFDIYVHVPIDKSVEAFGQTYVEALASGVPSVFTLSGVANEFITDRRNALVADHCNSQQILVAVEELLTDKNLRNRLITNGLEDIKIFDLKTFIARSEKVYLN